MSLTYKQAGIDISAGDRLVDQIRPLARATDQPGVLGGLGGFAGLFAVPTDLVDPVLVSGTDGVGTKLLLAHQMGVHHTLGIDLVAMCVNDILTTGARPLFFLDYFATGKLDVEQATAVISGIAAGCQEAGCALLGGETAELPGMYAHGQYDLAGFAVGIVPRAKLIDGHRVQAGDVALGFLSTGLHSNGYSLARKVLLEQMQLSLDERPAALHGQTLGEALLAPTPIYVRAVQALLQAGIDLHAMSHITGGGVPGNLPRVIPRGLGVQMETPWPRPPLFPLIQEGGGVSTHEMRRVFNEGIGFVLLLPEQQLSAALEVCQAVAQPVQRIGHVVPMPEHTPLEERIVYAW